jgi:hypothetical protein
MTTVAQAQREEEDTRETLVAETRLAGLMTTSQVAHTFRRTPRLVRYMAENGVLRVAHRERRGTRDFLYFSPTDALEAFEARRKPGRPRKSDLMFTSTPPDGSQELPTAEDHQAQDGQ